MPTYEYECPNGHHFELFQRMSDEPRASCPECGAESQRLLSGGAGFLFKGEGFYATDYRSESYKRAASKEKSPEGGAASESGGGGKDTHTKDGPASSSSSAGDPPPPSATKPKSDGS